ncbi:MAG: hypothetical protein IPM25_15345 [Chloracidobacterium sp.]|nr:hypothetical protein [Chloracidobacterium sp.]
MIERLFQVAAVVLSVLAVYFYWAKNNDGMYVAAVMAAVSFFLSIRFQVKERNRLREIEDGRANDVAAAESSES